MRLRRVEFAPLHNELKKTQVDLTALPVCDLESRKFMLIF
jgi:hypothetical protein